MRIGVMMREVGKQFDAPGIIVMNLVDRILAQDRVNEYVLFFPNDTFLDRYKGYPNVKCVKVKAPAKIVWDQIALPLAARRENVDLIFHPKHSLPLLTGRKTLMHLRGAEYWIFPAHFELPDLLYQKLFLPLFCRKATYLIAETHDVAKDFKKYLRMLHEKMSVVYLAANERFCVIEDQQELVDAKQQYGLPDRFMLTVTRVVQGNKYYPGKNILNILEAFRISAARRTTKLVVVGSHTRDFVQRRLGQHDDLLRDLVLLDFVPQMDLPVLYNLAEAFLFPSTYESFGIPILEAMACGCPVITSKTFSCPEVAGGSALLVDPANVSEICGAIDRLNESDNLRQEMGRRGLGRAAQITWKDAAAKTIEIFNRIEYM